MALSVWSSKDDASEAEKAGVLAASNRDASHAMNALGGVHHKG
jgi:hypothetical protein